MLVAEVLGFHQIFVRITLFGAGDEYLPNATGAEPHGMAPRVPIVEIAGH